MRRIQTVIFDASGVLLNDLHAVWKADSEAYEACGLGRIEKMDKFKETFKLPIYEYHKSMGVPDDMMPRLEAEYRRVYPKHSNLIKIFPEVKEVLSKLRDGKIALGIASNIPSDFLSEHLQRFGLDKFFEVVTGQDDCKEQKPSPEPILTTLSKLGLDAARSAYVGDMEEDMIAGKRAHVCTIAMCRDQSYHPCWKLKRQKPDFLIHDLHDLLQVVDDTERKVPQKDHA